MRHGRQPEVDCFLFWHGFAPKPRTGKALVLTSVAKCDGVKILQKWKKLIQFPVAVRGSKRSVLKFPFIYFSPPPLL